jgi:hypothetical protein
MIFYTNLDEEIKENIRIYSLNFYQLNNYIRFFFQTPEKFEQYIKEAITYTLKYYKENKEENAKTKYCNTQDTFGISIACLNLLFSAYENECKKASSNTLLHDILYLLYNMTHFYLPERWDISQITNKLEQIKQQYDFSEYSGFVIPAKGGTRRRKRRHQHRHRYKKNLHKTRRH